MTFIAISIAGESPAADALLAESLLVLQHRAYAVEAESIGDDRIPRLHETVQQLSAASVEWLIARTVDGTPVGALAWTRGDEVVEIDRLVVEPALHRRGIGSTLMSELLDAAAETPVVVATAAENAPARSLYESFGFRHVTDEEVLPELWVSRYLLDGNVPTAVVTPDQYYARLARVRQGSGALITTDDGRVVMFDVSYREYFEIPGGAVEAGESPPAACARECAEELGVDIEIGRVLVIDHQTDGGEQGDSIMFVYDGGFVDEAALTTAPTDEGRVVLVDPKRLDEVTLPRLAGRVRAALLARETGEMIEAVQGVAR